MQATQPTSIPISRDDYGALSPASVQPKAIMTKSDLSLVEESGHYLLRLPFEYKDAFRVLFKTAKWDGTKKAFVARATSANRRKWEAFEAQAQQLEPTLAARDEAEATELDLRQMVERLNSVRCSMESAFIAADKRMRAHEQTVAQLQCTIEDLEPQRLASQAMEVEVREAARKATEAAKEATAPALAVLRRHGIDKLFDRTVVAVRQGYARKDLLRDLSNDYSALRRDLNAIGYRHQVLDDFQNVSLNRPDKFEEAALRLRATLLTRLESVDVE